jgi:hypothetical protein
MTTTRTRLSRTLAGLAALALSAAGAITWTRTGRAELRPVHCRVRVADAGRSGPGTCCAELTPTGGGQHMGSGLRMRRHVGRSITVSITCATRPFRVSP